MHRVTVQKTMAIGLAACASYAERYAQANEEGLRAAGFTRRLADTPEKLASLQAMTQRRILVYTRLGQPYYVWPDARFCRCFYIGSEAQYQEYARLGFEKEWEHQFEPGFPWFVAVVRGNVHIYLSEHKGDARPNTLVHLYIQDVDRVSEEFGIPVDEEGLAGREVHLEDADGNRLRVATRRS